MAGHSHSANIARRKSAVDGKRAKVFTKVAKDIIVAARDNGRDPGMNPRLRLAIEKAKAVNMPKDKIEYAILRGIGEVEGASYEERVYEGFAPNGVGIIVDALTDNINRTSSDIRHTFSKNGGNLGDPGCVSWDFKTQGLIIISAEGIDEDDLMMTALDAGAEDVSKEKNDFEIVSLPENFTKLEGALKEANYEMSFAEITKTPGNKITLDLEKALKIVSFIDLLEELQDTQNIYSNLEYTPELLEQLEKE